MKKILIIILVIVLIAGSFLTWYLLKIKPLKVSDITEASSSNLASYVGFGIQEGSETAVSLGELNPMYQESSGSAWKDNNNFVTDAKKPLRISVSNQEGPVPEQVLTIVYDDGESMKIYVPSLSGEGGPWAYFFVDKKGSTYWACAANQPCDSGTISSSKSLKKEHLARKSPN